MIRSPLRAPTPSFTSHFQPFVGEILSKSFAKRALKKQRKILVKKNITAKSSGAISEPKSPVSH